MSNPQQIVALVAALLLCGSLRDSASAEEGSPLPRRSEPAFSRGKVIHVGPSREVRTFRAAAAVARNGDTIEVDPGKYSGDTAIWTQSDLIIRGVGIRPTLVADGASAEGKGIFVVRGDTVTIENLGFVGAQVADHNGAGIRHERGRLTVVKCAFEENENGILTANDPAIELQVIDSIFINNGADDGYSHHLYAGAIAQLNVVGSYFGPVRKGHLLKSRAKVTSVSYSRLTGEASTSSYEIDIPNGGSFRAIGNLIQQGVQTENSTMISYGAEGYRWPTNHAYIAFNTLVNDRGQAGVFIAVRAGAADAAIANNIFLGRGEMQVKAPAEVRNNVQARGEDFASPSRFDYRLRIGSPLIGSAGFAGAAAERPTREYQHIGESVALVGLTQLTPLSPGAFQRVAR